VELIEPFKYLLILLFFKLINYYLLQPFVFVDLGDNFLFCFNINILAEVSGIIDTIGAIEIVIQTSDIAISLFNAVVLIKPKHQE
jgi:hypothetical protein